MKKTQSFDITILPASLASLRSGPAGGRYYDIKNLKNIFLSFYLSIVLSLILLFLFSKPVLAIVNGPATPDPPYAQNQLIVKYKQGQDAEELERQVSNRRQQKNTFFGFFSLLWQDLTLRLKNQERPEVKLSRLKKAEQEAGVVEKEKLFQSEEVSLSNFYLLKTDGRLSVGETIKLYQALPEVEFAEPNYIYSIMGI